MGILAGSVRNWVCIPLSIRFHDGLQATKSWENSSVPCVSHVVQMGEDAYKAARGFGDSLLLLDRYFLTVPALEKLRELNSNGAARMEIITKAKNPAWHLKGLTPVNQAGDVPVRKEMPFI